jgi:SAM-dependent methyltransferase
MRNLADYHLGELKIALDPSHTAHCLPQVPAEGKVLDIGCGIGQILIATCPGRLSFGIDVDLDALQLGRTLTPQVAFTCAAAEELPFRTGIFDMVISRVSLPYTHIPRALAEIARVLKPGGVVWLTLHSWRIPWKAAKSANWRGRFFFVYVVLNSLLFHATQRLFHLPKRNHESFQTRAGMMRALQRAGFEQISIEIQTRHFVATANRR